MSLQCSVSRKHNIFSKGADGHTCATPTETWLECKNCGEKDPPFIKSGFVRIHKKAGCGGRVSIKTVKCGAVAHQVD